MGISPWVMEIPSGLGLPGRWQKHCLKSHSLGEIVIGGGRQRAVDQHSIESSGTSSLSFKVVLRLG